MGGVCARSELSRILGGAAVLLALNACSTLSAWMSDEEPEEKTASEVKPAEANPSSEKPTPPVTAPALTAQSERKVPTASVPGMGEPVKELSPKELAADAKRDFERAQGLLQKGEESQALISFTDFLRRYPNHELVGDAQYSLGEILFRQRRYQQALGEFLKVKDLLSGKSPKIPFAYVRIGECRQRLGQPVQAQIEWNAVIRRFPQSPAANEAKILLKGIPQ